MKQIIWSYKYIYVLIKYNNCSKCYCVHHTKNDYYFPRVDFDAKQCYYKIKKVKHKYK